MNNINFSPKKDIEEYLNNDFNTDIYDDLTGHGIRDGWEDIFEPLEFFNLLYKEYGDYESKYK